MKSLKQTLLFPLFLLVFHASTQAQEGFFKRTLWASQFHYGSFLTNEPKAVYVKDSYSYFGELNFQQPAFKASRSGRPLTYWGAGLFFGHSGSKRYIGKMAGAFSFIKLPVFTFRSVSSHIRLGAGLGWIQKPYNTVTNHKNVIIGSPINGYVNVLWQNEFAIAKNAFFNAGLSFTHLSNGSSSLPNMGLNIPAVSLGVRYGVSRDKHSNLNADSTSKNWRLNVYTSIGVKQTPWIGSKRYLINVAASELSKKVSFRSQLGLGAFVFFDRSLGIDPNTRLNTEKNSDKLQSGLYAAYEYKVGKLALPFQIGVPLINRSINQTTFQQIGIRYSISQRLTSQLLLKSYTGRADVMHLGIGYKIL